MTNYTQGGYSLHLILKNILNSKINYINNGNFLFCILIYIFSYIISFIGEKVNNIKIIHNCYLHLIFFININNYDHNNLCIKLFLKLKLINTF